MGGVKIFRYNAVYTGRSNARSAQLDSLRREGIGEKRSEKTHLSVGVDQTITHLRNDSSRRLSLQLCGEERVRHGQKSESQRADWKKERRTEGGLDNADLGSGGVDTGEGAPIVNDETRADDIRTSVNGTSLATSEVT
jgi:hypothetical protein